MGGRSHFPLQELLQPLLVLLVVDVVADMQVPRLLVVRGAVPEHVLWAGRGCHPLYRPARRCYVRHRRPR
jgi:hypothetical protein